MWAKRLYAGYPKQTPQSQGYLHKKRNLNEAKKHVPLRSHPQSQAEYYKKNRNLAELWNGDKQYLDSKQCREGTTCNNEQHFSRRLEIAKNPKEPIRIR